MIMKILYSYIYEFKQILIN